MAISFLILCLLACVCFFFYAAQAMSRKGGFAQVFTAAFVCAVVLAIGAALLLPLAGRQTSGSKGYRVLDDAYEAVLVTEWSELSAGEYANYPSFRSAVSGMLGNAVAAARRCGVRGQYVQNLVTTGLSSESLSPFQIDEIRQTVLSRDGSRWILEKNTPPVPLPKQYLEVAFDVQGNQDKGNIQIKVDVKENGESVTGNQALPFAVLAEYTNQPWVEQAAATDQENQSQIIGRSQRFPRLEDARSAAMTNARLRCFDSAIKTVESSRPDTQIKTKLFVESYLDNHPELKKDDFVQQTRGPQGTKYRVAVLMDFPQDSILQAMNLPGNAPDSSWRKQAIGVIALTVLLLLAFLFLDAGRRGRYTWPLRFGTAIVFTGLCVLLWKIGPLM